MTKTGAWLRACLMGAAAGPMIGAGAAVAAASDASANAAAGPTDVGEIVVTATRKEENLSKVALSVSAFTAAKMDVQGIKSFADVAKFSPGVTYQSDSHDISIRGIQSTAGSGTTGIYIDDTPVQVRNLGLNANNTLPVVFDLARVEVLRGPQGTLFGAGSEGGTVRYITNQPSLTHFSGFAHAEVALTAAGGPSYEVGLAEGGPLIQDKLGFRISAWGRRDGGWIDRVNYQSLAVTDADANRVDTYALRAALTWAPVSNLTITPGIDYQKRDQHNYDFYWVSISHPGSYQSGTPDRMADPDRFLLPTLKIQYDLPHISIISNTSYYDRLERVNGYSGTIYNLSFFQHFLSSDPTINQYGQTFPLDPQGVACTNNCGAFFPLLTPTGPNVPGFSNYYAQNLITNAQQNFTQEIRVQSNDTASRLQWTAGFFYAFDRQQSKEEIRDPELPQLTQLLWNEDMITAWGEELLPNGDDYINNTRAHDRQEALFADVTYAITGQLRLNVGLRYAWTKFVFRNTNDGPQDLLSGPPSFDNGGLAEGGKSEQPFTPKVNVTYQLTPDDMVYATVSKGYRIGGATPPLPPNCGTGFPTSYGSDNVWSYELGTKDRFFDRRLQVAASGYYIRWFGIQQAFYVPVCGIQFTTNAGQAVSDGFDLQSQWQVTRALDLELSVGYNNARFSKTALDANGDVLDVKGDALDVAPWIVAAAAQYNFTVVGRDAFVRADYEFTGKRTAPIPNEDPATAFYDPGLVPNPPIHQVSLRAGVTIGDWDFALYANNLLNAHPQLDLTHQDAATTLYEATTLRPRTIGISANVKY
jgi:outer membrane receptor protein involved in Fe transport